MGFDSITDTVAKSVANLRIAGMERWPEATKTIGQFWKRKNARRNGLSLENWRMTRWGTIYG
jgi:hypothetical protein